MTLKNNAAHKEAAAFLNTLAQAFSDWKQSPQNAEIVVRIKFTAERLVEFLLVDELPPDFGSCRGLSKRELMLRGAYGWMAVGESVEVGWQLFNRYLTELLPLCTHELTLVDVCDAQLRCLNLRKALLRYTEYF